MFYFIFYLIFLVVGLTVKDCLLRASGKVQLGFNNRPWVIETLPSTCHHFHSPKVGDDHDTQNTALLLVQMVCFLPQGLLGSTASSTFRPWEFPVQKKVVNTSATRVKSHAKICQISDQYTKTHSQIVINPRLDAARSRALTGRGSFGRGE